MVGALLRRARLDQAARGLRASTRAAGRREAAAARDPGRGAASVWGVGVPPARLRLPRAPSFLRWLSGRRTLARLGRARSIWLWAALFLAVFLASLAGGLHLRSLLEPAQPGAPSHVLEFGPGSSTTQIARRLEQEGIIKSAWVFRALARYRGLEDKLMAGEYRLSAALSPGAVLTMLARGQVVTYQVTVPEGLTVKEIAALLESKGFGKKEALLAAARDASLLPEHLRAGRQGLPIAEPLEGYLFPDTYRLSRRLKEPEIVAMMVRRLAQVLEPYRPRAAEFNLSLHQVLTLASIIEREARVDQERPIISSVYHNRLRLGMKLDSCPTVMYAFPVPKTVLTYDDLKVDSPYNTYLHAGLPPGPIAAPGEACIRAALYPADTPYLYFVSKNDGTHEFSRTLAEHLRAKSRYQSP